MKFELGYVVMTRGIADAMENSELFKTEVDKAFEKYMSCDWGDTCKEDAEMNNEAVKTGEDRIFDREDIENAEIHAEFDYYDL